MGARRGARLYVAAAAVTLVTIAAFEWALLPGKDAAPPQRPREGWAAPLQGQRRPNPQQQQQPNPQPPPPPLLQQHQPDPQQPPAQQQHQPGPQQQQQQQHQPDPQRRPRAPPQLPPACGAASGWAGDYAALHASIASGAAPPRFLVHMASSGLSDNLAGAVTAFYFALLSGRALVLEGSHWRAAFDPAGVDWGFASTGELTARLAAEAGGARVELVEVKVEEADSGDVASAGGAAPAAVLATFTGATHRLFHNPRARARLHAMGLRPDTAFGCAYTFLFSPRPDALALLAPAAARLRAPGALRVGIQIRTGDDAFFTPGAVGPFGTPSQLGAFAACAAEAEAAWRAAEGQPVVWFLVSDSAAVRRRAAELYPGKVVTALGLNLNHSCPGGLARAPGWRWELTQCDRANASDPTNPAAVSAAEQWLLAECDVFVLSARSGFGRLAAARSLRWGATCFLDNEAGAPRPGGCGRGAGDAYADVARMPPGL
ncbi:hypothetical protein Rsub_13115 [Raphidocelis subcapitata]|uniref:Uncharacterized protein n=1 Tax=Raphidocelis subcapitata TaxID=307507 RepID=A0A2V0PPA2_9CHLO|nr:hypothetical protein Rsub_13115 [Raphidocelis subcapitata]|eukprot:GBF99983.1 hypothetical protein Rsub_13115 [Raphidocelis subcapitata]